MTEQNRALAIRWFEQVWNVRDEAIIDQVMGPQALGHMEGIDVVGPAEFKKVRDLLLQAFPDLRVTVEATAADRDNVVVRWNATGTHRGSGFGIEATGKPVAFRGMTWFVMKERRFVEGWDAWNQGGIVESLRAAASGKSSG
jgi:predicted ester cyclase